MLKRYMKKVLFAFKVRSMWVRKRDYWKPCSVIQLSCSVVSNPLQPHELQHSRLPCPSPTLELAQTHVHWVIQPSRPLLLLPLLLSVFPSIRVFSSESVLRIRWPKYWNFSFNISPSNEYSGLISFRMDWFDFLAVHRTLKESSPTPQFKNINSSALSFLYGPTLTFVYDYWIWGGKKVISRVFLLYVVLLK